MKNSLKKAAVAALATAGIAAGTVAGTAPAQAATPNLALTGGVYCHFGLVPGENWGVQWYMVRHMEVTAQNADFKNVTLQEIAGEKKFKGLLKKGEQLKIETKWPGCFPSSISGYTISDYAENLLDNAGFWWNLRRIENPRSQNGVSAPASGGGVGVKGSPAIP